MVFGLYPFFFGGILEEFICGRCELPKYRNDFYDYYLTQRKTPICKVCVRAQVNKHYKGLKERGLCNDCGETLDRTGRTCSKCLKRRKAILKQNPERSAKWGKEFRQRTKLAAFNAYGGPVCKCCGESELSFLSLDHINNDGAEHRREISKDGDGLSVRLALWCKKKGYPPGFQVLCMNCQFGKKILGICPHVKKLEFIASTSTIPTMATN